MRSPQAGYRADIDGLRAIAVLSVVLYHINKAWVPGGYVGVDIFFVISGYLITRNIWSELQAGRFSLQNFYLRRIRRIAPAFLAVTACTLIAGALLLLPHDLVRLARSAIWASLSAANIYYWKYLDTGYFAAGSDEEPLLHMWSLGVEEQYYLIWPTLLMLLMLARRRRPLLLAIGATLAIGAASFALAELTNVDAQKFSYYMLPARAGELMVGGALALWGFSRAEAGPNAGFSSRWLVESAAMAGLGLLAFSFYWLDDSSAFPGINAVYPCIGAALVMFSGQRRSRITLTLLTLRPMVLVGLVSYSLYLWHWPILAFTRYFFGEVSPQHAVIAMAAMLLLATASYRLVEQPFRRMRARPWAQVAGLFAAPVVVIALSAGTIIRDSGAMPYGSANRLANATAQLDQLTAAANRQKYPCMDARDLEAALRDDRCVLGAGIRGRQPPPSVLIWGDSNAGHYLGMVQAVAEHDRFNFRYVSLSTCPSLFGNGEWGAPYARKRCSEFRERVRRFIADSPGITTVILASQWASHQHNPQFKASLQRTIGELEREGKRIIVLGQAPGFPTYKRECDLRWAGLGSGTCATRARRSDQGGLAVNTDLQHLAAADAKVAYADIDDILCREGTCSPYLDGVPVYFNPTHLSAAGSYRIGKKLIDAKAHDTLLVALAGIIPPSVAVLPGGYEPTFAYRIRSQRHTKMGRNRFQHVLIVEYMKPDATKVAGMLVDDLREREFSIAGPVNSRGADRYVADQGGTRMTIWIYPRPALQLSPGAGGVVYFAWSDGNSRLQ